jgi:uncharacterized delta-60 repeat protein
MHIMFLIFFWGLMVAFLNLTTTMFGGVAFAPGSLDPAFNAGTINGAVRVLVIQPDDKILIAGDFTSVNGLARHGLARLNRDGALDLTFNPAPELTQSPSNHITDLALQTNGNILLGGLFDLKVPNATTNTAHLVLRLLSDGSLDTSYGPVLVQYVHVPLESMILQPDQKLVIGFRTMDGHPVIPGVSGVEASHIIRLDRDGRADSSFTPITSGTTYLLSRKTRQLCLEPSGSLLAVWCYGIDSDSQLRRYDASGAPLEFTHAIMGIQTGLGPVGPAINRIMVEKDGRLVVNGQFNVAGAPVLYNIGYSLTRLMANGAWDKRLIHQTATAYDVFPDHRLLAVANDALCRLNSIGVIDPFWTQHPISKGIQTARQQSNGGMLVAGDFSYAGHDRLLRLYGENQTPRPPITQIPPTNQVIMNTNAFVLSVWADGYPLVYQWQRDGFDLPGETNDAIRVEAQPANYTVVVSNAMGAVTSSVAQVGVLDLAMALNTPGWTWTAIAGGFKNPTYWHVDTNVTHDGMASAVGWYGYDFMAPQLETTVRGPGTLTFWQTGGPGYLYVRNPLWDDYVSVTWASYQSLSSNGPGPWLLQTVPIPAGQYRLEWATHNFPWIFAKCYLDEVSFVPNPPGAPEILERQSADLGTNRTLSVLLAASELPLSYQWLNVDLNRGLQAIPGATNASLTVTTDEAGYYAVVVSNTFGATVSEPAKAEFWPSAPPVTLTASLDSEDGQLRLTVNGASMPSAVIQMTGNFFGWQDLATVACTNGSGSVIDPAAKSQESRYRFYRALSK